MPAFISSLFFIRLLRIAYLRQFTRRIFSNDRQYTRKNGGNKGWYFLTSGNILSSVLLFLFFRLLEDKSDLLAEQERQKYAAAEKKKEYTATCKSLFSFLYS